MGGETMDEHDVAASGTGGGRVEARGRAGGGSGGGVAQDALKPCAVCGASFRPCRPTHLTCSRACRVTYDLDALSAEAGVPSPAGRDPWRLPAPARRVPAIGRSFDVQVVGGDAGLYDLRNATLMHGVLTALTDLGHEQSARFSAWPDGSHWTMLLDPSSERGSLGGRTHRARVGKTWRDVAVSEGATVEAPRPPLLVGRYRVSIETLSPVVIRAGAEGRTHGEQEDRRTRTAPDASNLSSALATTALARLGWRQRSPEVIPVELVSSDTRPAVVALREASYGGKMPKIGGDGCVRGWEGSLVVETSAMGAWLLLFARRVGLGGRVAYGFGRVRVGVEYVGDTTSTAAG